MEDVEFKELLRSKRAEMLVHDVNKFRRNGKSLDEAIAVVAYIEGWSCELMTRIYSSLTELSIQN